MTPTIIRSNAKGTVNRAQLRKLVEAGKVEARVDYRYDDMGGESRGDWMPARLSAGYSDFVEGAANLDADDFGGHGRAYINESGRLLLRIHANLVWELRVVATAEEREVALARIDVRAAKLNSQGDFPSWMGVAS